MTYKRCRECGETRPHSEFYARTGSKDGLRSDCKQCCKDRDRNRYYADPDLTRERYLAHQAKNREANAERARTWRKNNPGRTNDLARAYRARKAGAFVEHVDRDIVISVHGRWCYLCETSISKSEVVEMEHVVPLSGGGGHSYDNIRPAHSACNRIKGTRQLHELDLPFYPPYLTVGP